MDQRAVTHLRARSLHLPPTWAWKDPERWFADTDVRYTPRRKLILPLDDRGFVKPDETVAMVKEQFISSFEWRRDPANPETRLDDHHFHFDEEDYKPIHHDGDDIPMQFRELPPMIGTMPRQFHNAIHYIVEKPPVPDIEAMREYVSSYQLAKQAFTNLHISAENTLQAQHYRWARRQDILKNPHRIGSRLEDTIGEEYNESQFRRHFQEYTKALETFKSVDNKDIIVPGKKVHLERATPQQILRLGKIVTRRAVDYQPLLKNGVA